MTFDGGQVMRVTDGGGDFAVEAPGGDFLVYQQPRTGATVCDLWVKSLRERGRAQKIASALPGAFTVTTDGVYFLRWEESDRTTESLVQFYDFREEVFRKVRTVEGRMEDITVSPDGQTFLFAKVERMRTDLMLVDGFK